MLLADDAIQVPTPFDQLPEQAWSYGPLFVIIAFMMLAGFGLALLIIRYMNKHLTEASIAVKGHLKESEITQKEFQKTQIENQATLQAVVEYLKSGHCRYPNGQIRTFTVEPGQPVIEQPSGHVV